MQLGRRKRTWPSFHLPAARGAITARDVMAAPARAERDRTIGAWCAAVWEAFADNRQAVIDLLAEYGIT
jgi:hypothetical protein